MTNSIIHQYLEPVIEKLVENMENLYLQTFSNQDIEISKFFHSINEITNELARDATTVLLERKDYDLCKNGQLQREGYTLKDYRSRTLTTTYGAVTFMRSYWLDSETKERMVVYRPLYERQDSKVWVRPEKMFFEEVPKERKDNLTGQKLRFELCEDLSKNFTK